MPWRQNPSPFRRRLDNLYLPPGRAQPAVWPPSDIFTSSSLGTMFSFRICLMSAALILWQQPAVHSALLTVHSTHCTVHSAPCTVYTHRMGRGTWRLLAACPWWSPGTSSPSPSGTRLSSPEEQGIVRCIVQHCQHGQHCIILPGIHWTIANAMHCAD